MSPPTGSMSSRVLAPTAAGQASLSEMYRSLSERFGERLLRADVVRDVRTDSGAVAFLVEGEVCCDEPAARCRGLYWRFRGELAHLCDAVSPIAGGRPRQAAGVGDRADGHPERRWRLGGAERGASRRGDAERVPPCSGVFP